MENEIRNKRIKMPPSQSATAVGSINDFPNEILTHILSFLPLKETFRTSVLSKRWVSLCYSFSDLYFEDDAVNNANDLTHFRQMLDAVMLSPRTQGQTLKSFYLECRSKLWEAEAYRFDKWVEAATKRCVKELHIAGILLKAPLASTIFCCKTIVVLKLVDIYVPTMLHYSVHLPSLKTLWVYLVQIECKEDFVKLLFGCPLLEDLSTMRVDVTTVVTEGGYFKPLTNLIKADIHLFDVPFIAVSNAQILTVMGMGESLPNEAIKDFPVFGNLTDLRLHWTFGDMHDWDEVVKMLQNCPKLQTLLIDECTDSSTTKEDWKYPDNVPECVSSHLTTCEIIDYQVVEADFRFASYILQNARLLQHMKILHNTNPMESPQFLDDLSTCTRISPACKLSLSES